MRTPLLFLCTALACTAKPPPPNPEPSWAPGVMYRTERAQNARGLLDRRGLIHSHSYYSHDACDGHPIDDAGVYDQQCYADFRAGLCWTGHDFDFLSDHRDSFDDNDFPDVLLYKQPLGDVLIEHGNGPTANRLFCPDNAPAPIVMAGNETEMMPLGLERHADGKGQTYGDITPASIAKIHDVGGLAVMAHTERWAADDLIAAGLDGFEMYNLHANTFKNLALAADWAFKADAMMFDTMPDPNIFLVGFNLEDPAYLTTWGTAFAHGAKMVTTMGTDCHRNSLPQLAADGERIDSYRRMMAMFSNHLLVRPDAQGNYDDRSVKEAFKAGRLYGAFEFMGYPEGFDYVAKSGSSVHEMGEEVPVGATLELTLPKVQRVDPLGPQPVLIGHIYRAIEGGWESVASGAMPALSFTTTTAGAYRAEVRIVPKHLTPWVGKRLDLIRAQRPWVYSNVIYVK